MCRSENLQDGKGTRREHNGDDATLYEMCHVSDMILTFFSCLVSQPQANAPLTVN